MYVYTLVFIVLISLAVASVRDTPSRLVHSRLVQYKHTYQVEHRSHDNHTDVQDEGKLSQKPDRCGPVAFRCYEPILSYIDSDGEFCGWNDMETFWTLPKVCNDIRQFSLTKWGDNAIKYNYKFLKVCDQIKTFQQCVKNNELCNRVDDMSLVMSFQNVFCNNIQTILPALTCVHAWDSADNWNKLVYTYDVIVHACPAKHYRQLSSNMIKLFLFNYITYPSSRTDVVADLLHSEAAGRLICQYIQQDLCLQKRADKLCTGYLQLRASQNYFDSQLIKLCDHEGKCNAFVKMQCALNLSTGHMDAKMDFQDITNVYDLTFWHAVGYSEVDILLHTVNKGIGHCDVSNLIFKQIGCFHQYIVQIDINHANQGNYLSEYMCSNIKFYNSCFEAYINSSCPDEANQFLGIGNYLHAQCNILRVANKNVTCPLLAVYSQVLFQHEAWYELQMLLMRQYIMVLKVKQMHPLPVGWNDVIQYNADTRITYYKAILIKGEKLNYAAYMNNNFIIATVCDQEAADVYKYLVTLSTGEQYYQLVNHVIKGFEYIKYLAQ